MPWRASSRQTALKESADVFERGVGGSQTRDPLEAVRHSLPDVERDAQARIGNLLGVADGVIEQHLLVADVDTDRHRRAGS